MSSNDFGKVGVLYGGVSSERQVSVCSGKAVHAALRQAGVDAHLFDLGERSLRELIDESFDRVINVMHGTYGEDGCVQGALELLGIPYACSGVTASAVALDKIMTKRLLIEEGLPTPRYHIVDTLEDLEEAARTLGCPFILKPPHEGSSLGLQVIADEHALPEQLSTTQQYEHRVLAEAFIPGRELTVAVMGPSDAPQALPVVEIKAPEGKYDFEHKYHSDQTQYFCPAELDPDVSARLAEISTRVYSVLGCEGWARVDIRLDEQNQPWILEINTNPGMTDHSLLPMAAAAAGMDFQALCLRVLSEARCKIDSKTKLKG